MLIRSLATLVEPLELYDANKDGLRLASFVPESTGLTIGLYTPETGLSEVAAKINGNWGEAWVLCPSQLLSSSDKTLAVSWAEDLANLPEGCSQVTLVKTDL